MVSPATLWQILRIYFKTVVLEVSVNKCQTEETYLWFETPCYQRFFAAMPVEIPLLCLPLFPFSFFFSWKAGFWENPCLSPPPSAFTSGSVGLVKAGCRFQMTLVMLCISKLRSFKRFILGAQDELPFWNVWNASKGFTTINTDLPH